MKVNFEVTNVQTNRNPGQPPTYNYTLTVDPEDPANRELFNGEPAGTLNITNCKQLPKGHGQKVTLNLAGDPPGARPAPQGGKPPGPRFGGAP